MGVSFEYHLLDEVCDEVISQIIQRIDAENQRYAWWAESIEFDPELRLGMTNQFREANDNKIDYYMSALDMWYVIKIIQSMVLFNQDGMVII